MSSTDEIEEDRPLVKMVVLDGIVMGPTHCGHDGCTSDLMNARGGAFCPFHETEFGNQCRVHNCQRSKVNPTQACDQHQLEWKKYVENHSQENLSGVRRILRSRENMPWQPNIQQNVQPHDEEMDVDYQRKHYFGPSRFYCFETICALC